MCLPSQGIGHALFECTACAEGSGQLLLGSDYTRCRVPMTAVDQRDARRPTDDGQPLGDKSAGQAGCIATPPTIDAVASLGIDHIDTAATPERVWRRAARRHRRAHDQICSGRSP